MKKLLAGIMASLMVFSLAACGGAPATSGDTGKNSAPSEGTKDTKKLKIGVVYKTLSSEFWSYMKAGAEAAGKELDVELSILGPNSESDVMAQVGMIEDLISQNVDALCIAPCQPEAVVSALAGAKEKGIPVVFVDTDAGYDAKASFIGTGNTSAAKLAGEHILKVSGEGKKIAVIGGLLGAQTSDERILGYKQSLEGKATILDVQPGDATADKAMAVMENYLQKFPEIDAVLSTNDDMAMGAVRAIEQNNRKGIKVIGFDAISAAVDLIMSGDMEASIAQDTFGIGYKGIEVAMKAAKGEKVEARIEVPAKLITKENAQEYKESLAKMLGK